MATRMSGKVRTVGGDVEPDTLGPTLIHEHLYVDWGEMLGRPKVFEHSYDQIRDAMVAKLQAARAVGIRTFVDCTPYGCGRYVDLFKDVAALSGVNVVGSTGFFTETWCPPHPLQKALDVDAQADLFTREIAEGMGATFVRAGMIKVATSEGRITPHEEKTLRAAARARKATGCPILAHTTNGMGPEQLDLFESEGLKPEEVVVSHVGFEPDPFDYAERLLRRGANVSIDRIGFTAFFPDEHWVALLRHVLGKGYAGQVLLSHDASVFSYGLESASGEHTWNDFGYISRVFVPRLQREVGVTDAQVRTILEDNPRRVLTFA